MDENGQRCKQKLPTATPYIKEILSKEKKTSMYKFINNYTRKSGVYNIRIPSKLYSYTLYKSDAHSAFMSSILKRVINYYCFFQQYLRAPGQVPERPNDGEGQIWASYV